MAEQYPCIHRSGIGASRANRIIGLRTIRLSGLRNGVGNELSAGGRKKDETRKRTTGRKNIGLFWIFSRNNREPPMMTAVCARTGGESPRVLARALGQAGKASRPRAISRGGPRPLVSGAGVFPR